MLKLVGLDDRWNHTPNQLSGGQQQRVAIARALSVDPPIILGDEPTGNLDSTTSGIIINLLSELNQKTGKTIILITHDPDVAMKASRVITVKDGKIEDDNCPRTGVRVCCHHMLDPPNVTTIIPTEIPTGIAPRGLQNGSHFRLVSRKKTKKYQFGWGNSTRNSWVVNWNQPDRKLGCARRVATDRLWGIP